MHARVVLGVGKGVLFSGASSLFTIFLKFAIILNLCRVPLCMKDK